MKIQLPIGKQSFEIECNSEDESNEIKKYAKDLNKRVNNILQAFGDVDNSTALAFAAIFLLQEHNNLQNKCKELESNNSAHNSSEMMYSDSLFPEKVLSVPQYIMESLIAKLTDLEQDVENLRF